MVFKTKRAAYASLREFAPWMRKRHTIVKFWSTKDEAWRYTRVLNVKGSAT